MLKHLSIKNYALIDHLELDFHNGFSVITGETGAGKSIMLSALALILGKRADLKSIKSQDRKCIVEGSFELQEKAFIPFFESYDLDYEHLSILRREISPSGKSRAFVNDTPVTLDVLASLTERLIDVHSQHQNLILNNSLFQLQLIDDFAENEKILSHYQEQLDIYKTLNQQKEGILDAAKNETGDSDYLQFLFEELKEANLKAGEQEDLEKNLDLAENSAEIQGKLSESIHLLEEEEQAVILNLNRAEQNLQNISKFDVQLAELSQRLESVRIEIDDINLELKNKLSNIEFEPGELERLDARLSLIISLQRKHQVNSVEALMEICTSLDQRIQNASGLEERIKKLDLEIQSALKELEKRAEKLHQSRLKLIPKLEKEISSLLMSLNFNQAKFKIDLLATDKFTEKGNNSIQFLFSANSGMALSKLSKVASGGELSRVMLALKAIMASTQNLPSIIFDEIDTGVSGETAGRIAEILKSMGNDMQVIAISHLAQIASKGKHHYKVEKFADQKSTKTHIYKLSEEQRIQELARLLSGEKISQAALDNAQELLQN
tara:strand:- start:58810 stop:60465 length:1656 start_codon:yes stop_codon:yes gene_type:complete